MIDEDPSDRGEITLMISDIIKQQLPYLFHCNFDIDETFQNVTRLSIRKQGKIGWEANPWRKYYSHQLTTNSDIPSLAATLLSLSLAHPSLMHAHSPDAFSGTSRDPKGKKSQCSQGRKKEKKL
jgi:hypothetical protein